MRWFMGHPPPRSMIVPNIICSCCSWESCDVSSSWSLNFMDRSRCSYLWIHYSSAFPDWPQALLPMWRGPSRTDPSGAWSHKPGQQHGDFLLVPITIIRTLVEMSLFFLRHLRGWRWAHVSPAWKETSQRPLMDQRQWAPESTFDTFNT